MAMITMATANAPYQPVSTTPKAELLPVLCQGFLCQGWRTNLDACPRGAGFGSCPVVVGVVLGPGEHVFGLGSGAFQFDRGTDGAGLGQLAEQAVEGALNRSHVARDAVDHLGGRCHLALDTCCRVDDDVEPSRDLVQQGRNQQQPNRDASHQEGADNHHRQCSSSHVRPLSLYSSLVMAAPYAPTPSCTVATSCCVCTRLGTAWRLADTTPALVAIVSSWSRMSSIGLMIRYMIRSSTAEAMNKTASPTYHNAIVLQLPPGMRTGSSAAG